MHSNRDRRRRTPMPEIPVELGNAGEGWISLLGHGSGFDDCPLCRELRSELGGEIETRVEVRGESLPFLARSGWLDDILELVGRDATVRVMGRDMQPQPIEEISMETFLARLGYD